MQWLGRQKRHWQVLVYGRLGDAYEQRARALGAQASSAKGKEGWTWLGSLEQSEGLLVDEVVQALKEYKEKVPGCEHLLTPSKLQGVRYEIRPDPLRVKMKDGLNAGESLDSRPETAINAEYDVVVPAYDLAKLRITHDQIEELGIDVTNDDAALVGVLQTRRTLKLHLALQKLAMFLGEQSAVQWLAMKRVDWIIAGLYGYDGYPRLREQRLEHVDSSEQTREIGDGVDENSVASNLDSY